MAEAVAAASVAGIAALSVASPSAGAAVDAVVAIGPSPGAVIPLGAAPHPAPRSAPADVGGTPASGRGAHAPPLTAYGASGSAASSGARDPPDSGRATAAAAAAAAPATGTGPAGAPPAPESSRTSHSPPTLWRRFASPPNPCFGYQSAPVRCGWGVSTKLAGTRKPVTAGGPALPGPPRWGWCGASRQAAQPRAR